MRDYNDPQYKKFRQDVKRRDGYKCRWPCCNARKKLQVHHILRWQDFPALRYVVSNGITLCKTHHTQVKNCEMIYAPLFTRIVGGII